MKMVLELFSERPNTVTLNEKLKLYGTNLNELKSESIDVILIYVLSILEDSILTADEMATLKDLKRYLRIKEGDFLKYHKENIIQEIIYIQMQHILEDLKVDRTEALFKTDLQQLFDLSYDQFLQFERKAIEEALNKGADI